MQLELTVAEWRELFVALKRLEERVELLERHCQISTSNFFEIRNTLSKIEEKRRYGLADLP